MYSKEFTETLLTAAGFSNSPRDLVSAGEDPHRYYYPYRTVTEDILCQDQWDYVVTQQEKMRNRCVIFLLKYDSPSLAAVMLWLMDINESARDELLKLFSNDKEKQLALQKPFSEQVLSEKQRLALSSLYRRIECFLVGSMQENNASKTWAGYLQTVYPKTTYQINVQPIDPNQQPEIVFTESLLRLGQQKPIGTMDIKQILPQHQQLCRVLLHRWWLAIQRDQPSVFAELETLTRRLLKYAMLQTLRQSYSVGMLKASYDELNILFSQDQTKKSDIYAAQLLDIFPLLIRLSFSTIVGLLAYRQPENLSGLIQLLQGECQKQQAQIKKWEMDLSKLCSDRRWLRRSDIAYFVAQQVYQYSLIGLGTELTPILSFLGLEAMGLTERFTPTQQRRLFTGLKWLGGGLGAYCTTVFGSYWLAKSFFVGNTSHWLHGLLQRSRLDDNTATVHGAFPLGKIGLSRSLHLSIAALESIVYGRIHHFTQALGGVLVSGGSVALGTQFAKDKFTQSLSPDMAALLFFCSVGGYDVGHLIAGYLHQGVDKLATREALSQAFCEMVNKSQYEGCATDFSATSAWSPSFWLSRQDTVRLNWQNAAGSQEAECDIISLTTGNHGVVCDLPSTLTVKRLG